MSADVPCLQEILTFVRVVAVLCQYSWFSCRSGPWRQSVTATMSVSKLKSMLDGVTCGLLLSILCGGSNLLLQCGDVELNSGPPKADTMRQTRPGSGTTPARGTDNPRTEGKKIDSG